MNKYRIIALLNQDVNLLYLLNAKALQHFLWQFRGNLPIFKNCHEIATKSLGVFANFGGEG